MAPLIPVKLSEVVLVFSEQEGAFGSGDHTKGMETQAVELDDLLRLLSVGDLLNVW